MSEAAIHAGEVGDIGPGAMLARARAERGVDTAEVAEHLKYRVRQIEALEADDYSRLPENTIVRGMIRSYAKFVGMDPAPFLKALEQRTIPAQASVDLRTQRIPFPDGNKRATHLYVALSIIVLLAIVVVLYEWHFSPAPPAVRAPSAPVARAPVPAIPARPKTVASIASAKQVTPAKPVVPEKPVLHAEAVMPDLPVATPSAEEAATPPAVEAATPAAEEAATPIAKRAAIPSAEDAAPSVDEMPRIRFDFRRESWVEIKDRDGKILLSQLNSAGTQKVVEGNPPFSIVVGNATGVQVTYKGVPVDLKRYMKSDVARLTLE